MHRIRHAARKLAKTPGFTLLAILTLAIGIGANAAIFAVVDAVLLRPLPYPEADRLLVLGHAAPGLGLDELGQSDAIYFHYRQNAESFETVGLVDDRAVNLTGLDRPLRLASAAVTPGGLELLRVPPILGRFFTEDEGTPSGPKTVVLSESLWQRLFDRDPAILGRNLEIDGVRREVVGVAPDLAFPETETELWTAMALDPNDTNLGSFGMAGFGRLVDGVTAEQAEAELDHLSSPLATVFPENEPAEILDSAGFDAHVTTLREFQIGDIENALWILLGTVGFVLLIACANVANLFLVRTEMRHRESAIRSALGASRAELALTGMIESLVLAVLAGGAGLGLAAIGVRLLTHFGPRELPRLHEVGIDPRVAVFGFVVSIVAGLLFGLIPAMRSQVRELGVVLKEGGRATTTGRERHLLRHALVAGQVALALMLLVGAGLMVRSFDRLATIDPGFRADDRTVTFGVSLPPSSYTDHESAERFFTTLVERLEALPGVERAAVTSTVPLGGSSNGNGHAIEDHPLEEGEPPPVFRQEMITPGYVEAAGLRLVTGRLFTAAEATDRAGVALVSRSLAETYWPGESPLGKRLSTGIRDDESWYSIVGVVADVRSVSLDRESPKTVYYPLVPKVADFWAPARNQDVLVRFATDPGHGLDAVRQAVWSLDPNLPITGVRTLDELAERSRARMAFTVVLLLIAASVAVVLGSVGTYGVVSYLVAQRRNEIGVRMALGARSGTVASMVLGQGLRLAAVGVVVGLIGAAALSRSLSAILFEVDPHDPLTFAVVPVLLIAVVALASLIPALRAARVDPMVALREE
ncbi:MAG: ABC transporter permease [Acidobacteriota bacterium]